MDDMMFGWLCFTVICLSCSIGAVLLGLEGVYR